MQAWIVPKVIELVRVARRSCPRYANGYGPVNRPQLNRAVAAAGIRVWVQSLDCPTLLLPPTLGNHQLLIDASVHRDTRDGYLMRHELGHVLAGDADEPTAFVFDYPLPEAELVADLFAFVDLIPWAATPADTWPRLIRHKVVLETHAWYRRIDRTVLGLRQLLQRFGPNPAEAFPVRDPIGQRPRHYRKEFGW